MKLQGFLKCIDVLYAIRVDGMEPIGNDFLRVDLVDPRGEAESDHYRLSSTAKLTAPDTYQTGWTRLTMPDGRPHEEDTLAQVEISFVERQSQLWHVEGWWQDKDAKVYPFAGQLSVVA